MVMKTIGRLILVPIAFLLAVVATAFVLFTLGLEQITHWIHGREGPELIEASLDMLWQAAFIITGATILPALALVIVGEVANIRSWLYYVLGGGAAMAAIPFMARLDPVLESGATVASIWPVFATAGFAGGFVYWLVAGRSA